MTAPADVGGDADRAPMIGPPQNEGGDGVHGPPTHQLKNAATSKAVGVTVAAGAADLAVEAAGPKQAASIGPHACH